MIHALMSQKSSWDIEECKNIPPEIKGLDVRSHDTITFYKNRPSTAKSYTTLNAYVVASVLDYIKGENAQIGITKVSKESFASEWTKEDGTTILASLSNNGKLRACIMHGSGRPQALPPITKDSDFDTTSIFSLVLLQLAEINQVVSDCIQSIKNAWDNDEPFDNLLYYLSDAMYFALNEGHINATVVGGNIEMLTKQQIDNGVLSGNVLVGKPNLINGNLGANSPKKDLTIKEARNLKFIKDWAKEKMWTEEEESLIPNFPDDYPVAPEVIKMVSRFIQTHKSKRPMVNFMWRGITSYGKSTGVEVMAHLLHTPLVRMTCHSTMETQNFLSDFVPDNDVSYDCKELPSIEDMSFNPEGAYFVLTGKEKEDATPSECLEAYASVIVQRSRGNNARFKHIESNFVKGLQNGYIVEIQEISRIKDSGVLVGLNEYDRAGAIIPLVDGSYAKRHSDAICVYTDNVGYASCRDIDPSVLRRMSFIIDSYDMPKETVLKRVIYNTGFDDDDLLLQMYEIWQNIGTYCKEQDITRGTVSVTELEMWCQSVMADDYKNLVENCIDCVVSKATSDIDEQTEIISSCLVAFV